jgi:CBS domain-containing protein
MAMKGILVKDLLSDKKQSELGSISTESTVRAAARVITDMQVGILVVFDEEKKFQGLISERDLARVLADHGSDAAEIMAIDVATKNVSGCRPDSELDFVLDTMKEKHFRHMPVMADN